MAFPTRHSLILLLSSLTLGLCIGEESESLRLQFEALQARQAERSKAVTTSMDQLYIARLRSLKLQAVRDGHYEAAQVYQAELKGAKSTPLKLVFYAEEAEIEGGLQLKLGSKSRVLTNWTSRARAEWNRLTLPSGGYAATVIFSGNGSTAVPVTLRESKYHVTATLPPGNGEEREASLGNIRLAEDTNTLTLTAGEGAAASGITIHQVILVSHAP